jgi:hypothetical protein
VERVVELGIDRLTVVDRAELVVDEAPDFVVVAGEADDQAVVIADRQIVRGSRLRVDRPPGCFQKLMPNSLPYCACSLREQLVGNAEVLVDQQVIGPIVDLGRVEVGDHARPGAAAVLRPPDSGRRAAARN